MPVVIRVENVSKAYQLGEFSSGTLTRDLERWWALYRGKEDPFLKIGETNDRAVKGESDIVWSLKDLNFSKKVFQNWRFSKKFRIKIKFWMTIQIPEHF